MTSDIEIKYIGVCSLLSRISFKLDPDDDLQYSIECALNDFMSTINDGQSRFSLVKLNTGIILQPRKAGQNDQL